MRIPAERLAIPTSISRMALFGTILAAANSTVHAQGSAQVAAGDRPDRCVAAAAAHHRVNEQLLRAILHVESRMKPATVTTNRNGSIDVGMAGTNSVHFPELKRYGIAPASLLDACVSTYVAAWHIRRAVQRYGNTWQGVAAYHSASGPQNYRYRILLHNELVRMRAVAGSLMAVPSLAQVDSRARPAGSLAQVSTPVDRSQAPTIWRVVYPKE